MLWRDRTRPSPRGENSSKNSCIDPLKPVGTPSTASPSFGAGFGTRWNASLPIAMGGSWWWRVLRQARDNHLALTSHRAAKWFSLSPRERAGVRGKGRRNNRGFDIREASTPCFQEAPARFTSRPGLSPKARSYCLPCPRRPRSNPSPAPASCPCRFSRQVSQLSWLLHPPNPPGRSW